MDRRIMRTALLLVGTLAFGANAPAAGPGPTMLSNACAGCHGTHGSSVGPALPTIAGLTEEYFIGAMKGYKEGERPATIMARIARGYGDDEIDAMAGWFARRPFGRAPQAHDARKAARGEKLHQRYCEICHGGGGRSAHGSSVLAGQRIVYLRHTLADFLAGTREAPEVMKERLDNLVDKEGNDGIEAIVQYHASQQ